jgi:hypothetical protein
MSVIVEIFSIHEAEVKVKEHFLWFISIDSTTAIGQKNDSGENMRQQCSEVQSKLLRINRRAFLYPMDAILWL